MYYKLNRDLDRFKKGAIILRNGRPGIDEEIDGIEYMDITTEMLGDGSYSLYDINSAYLDWLPMRKQNELAKMLSDFIESNYKINTDILNY